MLGAKPTNLDFSKSQSLAHAALESTLEMILGVRARIIESKDTLYPIKGDKHTQRRRVHIEANLRFADGRQHYGVTMTVFLIKNYGLWRYERSHYLRFDETRYDVIWRDRTAENAFTLPDYAMPRTPLGVESPVYTREGRKTLAEVDLR
jgi:hypothetical protein